MLLPHSQSLVHIVSLRIKKFLEMSCLHLCNAFSNTNLFQIVFLASCMFTLCNIIACIKIQLSRHMKYGKTLANCFSSLWKDYTQILSQSYIEWHGNKITY